MVGGKPTIIQAAEGTSIGGKAFPSVVAFTKDGQLIVGEPARRQMISNPEGTVIAAKRKMGTDFKFKVYGKEYTLQQISSFILQKIKRDSEAFLEKRSIGQSLPCLHTSMIISDRRPRTLEKLQVFK